MKKIILILLFTIPFIAFGQNGLKKVYHKNGNLETEMNIKNTDLAGIQREYYQNGKLQMEMNVINGQYYNKKCWSQTGRKIKCD